MDLHIEKSVQVAMRDGVRLATDVYRPAEEGRFPTIVSRLPYDKELPIVSFSFDTLRAVQAGYVVVVQDCRGRYASQGDFTAFVDEAADGADAIAWAAAQPWSTGAVGMVGGSYFGATQWLAATQAPAALRAIAPFVTTDQYYESWAYQGGAFQLGFNLHWCLLSLGLGELLRRLGAGTATPEQFAELVVAVDGNDELYRRLPLTDMPLLDELAPYYQDWLAHPCYDGYWQATAPRESYDQIVVPALNMGGWYDLFLKGTIANYLGMKEHGGSEQARRQQRLVIGPWAHGPLAGWFPERSYGLMSGTDASDITGLQLRWFDQLLKGEETGVEGDKPVRLFVMGVDEWRDEDDWPLPDTDYVDYFLHSGGHANTAAGDGRLSVDGPADEPEDVYLYDPRDPVPTVGGPTFLPGLFIGANAGPRDQRDVERRQDVLSYTSEPLAESLTVIGPVALVLHGSSSAPDTDFTGKLVDVWPDGRAEVLADGILRARYRDSFSEPSLLEPGQVYELRIDLVATANVFAVGHRIRLDVSSSNFPRFDRNTNTGATIATDGPDDVQQAVNRVHHTSVHPSRLVLPVIRR
ncbi:MAG: CocE/NonD family hydrolase [Nocardioidaceae bacterium]|nr:CocE/NonD family hydrolase [Nocardioidaceae bacterium]